MSFLTVKNIVKSFGKTEVIKDVSFEMNSTSRLALIGKSGSGKTTMLRIIAGLEIPDRGEVAINGSTLNSKQEFVKPEKRNVGYVFQNHSLFPHLNVYDNIVFGVRKADKKDKKQIAQQYLSMLGLEDKLLSFPHQLSGGEKQRISIIRSLAAKPKLLLLDEPFSNLDKNTKEKLKQDLKEILDKEQLPTIMITHDAEDSFDLADETILLDSGVIMAKGNPEELYLNPTNEHSALFFSESIIVTRSETNAQFFNHFNISSDKVCISPQKIRIANEGINATVINHKFVGNGYIVSVDCMGAIINTFTLNKFKNQNIIISLDPSDIKSV